jgi:hypothetical protein
MTERESKLLRMSKDLFNVNESIKILEAESTFKSGLSNTIKELYELKNNIVSMKLYKNDIEEDRYI